MSLSKYSEKDLTPDVGSKPNQPLTNFKFPYRGIRKTEDSKARIPTFMVFKVEVVALRRGYR